MSKEKLIRTVHFDTENCDDLDVELNSFLDQTHATLLNIQYRESCSSMGWIHQSLLAMVEIEKEEYEKYFSDED